MSRDAIVLFILYLQDLFHQRMRLYLVMESHTRGSSCLCVLGLLPERREQTAPATGSQNAKGIFDTPPGTTKPVIEAFTSSCRGEASNGFISHSCMATALSPIMI